jgi:DNA polymerase III alpha subunit
MTKYMPVVFWGDPAEPRREDNFPTTQFDMYDCEKRGHLKMDYLGLKTLRVIAQTKKAINVIKRLRGEPADFDIDKIDRFDQPDVRDAGRGQDVVLLPDRKQFVRNFAKRMGLGRCDPWQLAVLVSIIRPGMMDTGMTEEYLRRANGEAPVTTRTRLLEDACSRATSAPRVPRGLHVGGPRTVRLHDGRGRRPAPRDQQEEAEGHGEDQADFIKGAVKQGRTAERGRGGVGTDRDVRAVRVQQRPRRRLRHGHPVLDRLPQAALGAAVHDEHDQLRSRGREQGGRVQLQGVRVRRRGPQHGHQGAAAVREAVASVCSIDLDDNTIRFGLSLIKKVSTKGVEWILSTGRGGRQLQGLRAQPGTRSPNPKGIPAAVLKVGKTDYEGLILSGALDCFEQGNRAKMLAMLPKVMDLCQSYWEQWGKEQAGKKVRVTSAQVRAALDAYTLEDDQYAEVTLEHRLEQEREVTGCFLSESPFQPYRGTIFAHCN